MLLLCFTYNNIYLLGCALLTKKWQAS